MPTRISQSSPTTSKNLSRSKAFFEALDYSFNPQFTDNQGASLILGEKLHAMLLVEDFARTFTAKPRVDAKVATEGWVCLRCDSREEVGALVAKAKAAGGLVPSEPQDYGVMCGHGFEDLDGHRWELVHMIGTAPQV